MFRQRARGLPFVWPAMAMDWVLVIKIDANNDVNWRSAHGQLVNV